MALEHDKIILNRTWSRLLKKIVKKIALAFPPIGRVHTDLKNRRRRVNELEGHLEVMKKQMSRALNDRNAASLKKSTVDSDITHLKNERNKAVSKFDDLQEKYDELHKEFCILSMSNEALLITNSDLLEQNQLKPKKATKRTPTKNKRATKVKSSPKNVRKSKK